VLIKPALVKDFSEAAGVAGMQRYFKASCFSEAKTFSVFTLLAWSVSIIW